MFHRDTQAERRVAGVDSADSVAMLATLVDRQAETTGKARVLEKQAESTVRLVAGTWVEAARRLSLKALCAS